jgi:outer membrane protein assembly factor BamB
MPAGEKATKGDKSIRVKTLLSLVGLTLLAGIACNKARSPLWHWTLESRCYADPLIDGTNVFIATQAGELISGEYKTGRQNWKRKLNGPVLATPAYSFKFVFAATENGTIYALDKETGEDIWRKQLEDSFMAPLTTAGDILLVPSGNGTLYALSQEKGEVRWMHKSNLKYNTRAIVSEPFIFIGGWGKSFYCLKMNGIENWHIQTGDRIVEEAILYRNRVYFPSRDDNIYAIEIPTGRQLWRIRASSLTNLILVDSKLCFANDQMQLNLLQPESGNLLKKISWKKPISRMYSIKGKCFFVSGQAYEVDFDQGKISQLLSLRQPIFKLAFPTGMVLATDDLYTVYGIERSESSKYGRENRESAGSNFAKNRHLNDDRILR